MDAIKKNRSCQKLVRSKLGEIEARIEELKKLQDRVKILKGYQVACRKRTGQAFSQKKDARVQLISLPKLRANAKFNEKKVHAIYKGPPENSHVVYYKEALTNFPVSLNREKWSKKERENLGKGVKQQIQKMLLEQSIDLLSDGIGSSGEANTVDSIAASIKDLDITPEIMRSFLPKIIWEQLAFMYLPCRTGVECQARWLNCEDPLINCHLWTATEDKNLLDNIQKKGLNNWIDIAVSLGTNRTPFQCLGRYQRSLNASIIRREWTEEEDNQLRAAVEHYGESNWQHVASLIEGRTGTQCSNRWMKTLHPTRKRVGRWTTDEDKRLRVAVTFFGPKWNKVSQFVPGRTQAQCRERWVNCLDPSLNMADWTEEEDSKLEAAILEHGYYWSKVAACVPPRTDNQCRRRWKALFPHEVPQLQAARKIQKIALISNFVDRESERPTLGPNDFVPLQNCIIESKEVGASSRKKRRPRQAKNCTEKNDFVPLENSIIESKEVDPSSRKKGRTRRGKNRTEKDASAGETCSEEAPKFTIGEVSENMLRKSVPKKKRNKRSHPANEKQLTAQPLVEYEGSNPTEEHPLPDPNMPMLTMAKELVDVHVCQDNTINTSKASKLHPRRRRKESHAEVPETSINVETLIGDSNLFNTETTTINANEETETANGDDHEKPITDTNELQCAEISETQSNQVCFSSTKLDESLSRQDQVFKVQNGSKATGFVHTYQRKRRRDRDKTCTSQIMLAETDRPNQRVEVEVEVRDDVPLAVFYNEQRKRKRIAAATKK